ncbi:MAG: S8 family peptidase [Schaalia odontolytica]
MSATSVRRHARLGITVASVLALAGGALTLPSVPARAVEPVLTGADQEYYGYYRLDSLHSQGYTGEGTIIAMIDGHVNTNVPELEGAHIENKSPCAVSSKADNLDHGTAVAQILVSPQFGIAPKATLYTYDLAFEDEEAGANCAMPGWNGAGVADTPLLIEQAINDGADIISISSNYPYRSLDLRWAMARAVAEGVIVVASMGNDSTEDPDDELPLWSGICGVGAINADGSLTDYSNWGNGIETAALGRSRFRSGSDGSIRDAQGTSFAAPIVAGFLAIAWQRFDDDVTSNQILQAMTATGVGGNGEWNRYTGFGAIDPWAMLNAAPSSLPDRNPCEEKPYASDPSWQDIEDYIDGTVNPLLIRNDDSYVYRGINEEAAFDSQHDYPVHLGTSPRYHAS